MGIPQQEFSYKTMAYSDFTLNKIKKTFSLNIVEEVDIFATSPALECSDLLKEIL